MKEIADVVLQNGTIYTVDESFSVAHGMAVRAGQILRTGSNEEIAQHLGPETTVIDLEGRTVLPGIDDSHLHAAAWGVGIPPYSLDLTFPEVESIADIVEALRRAVAEKKPGEWVIGRGWDVGYLAECVAGRRVLPNKNDLDAASPDNPVCFTDFSGHLVWVNSAGLEAAGIDASSETPAGGMIDKDSFGEPTGILRESAKNAIQDVMPALDYTLRKSAISRAVKALNAAGITAFTEPGLGPGGAVRLGGTLGSESVQAYEELAESGDLTARVSVLMLPLELGEDVSFLRQRVEDQLAGLARVDERLLNVIGVKLFADGVPPNETAYMHEPYGPSQGHGALCTHGATEALQEGELRAAIRTVHDLGLQAGVHVTGDRGIDITVDAFVHAFAEHPREDARHYVIHGDFISDERLRHLGERGYGVNMNPGIKAQITDLMDSIVGEEMSARQWPTRSAEESGALLCASSDAPVTPPDWLVGIAGMMTRASKATGRVSGPEERVDFATALRAYTINAARQSFAETWRGSLEAGKVADFVVIDRDPQMIPASEIPNIGVEMTYFDGTLVFDASTA